MVPTESSYRADLREQCDCVKADFVFFVCKADRGSNNVDNAVMDLKIVHSHTQAHSRQPN